MKKMHIFGEENLFKPFFNIFLLVRHDVYSESYQASKTELFVKMLNANKR